MRCMHESKCHARNAFVTLTYRDDHLHARNLVYEDFQLFRLRARRKLGPFSYLMAGEYGEENWRPHFHALLFGVSFPDRYHWKDSPSGSPVYRSELLESLWKKGFSSVGDVTYESAMYVARYVIKKQSAVADVDRYSRVDPVTGEEVRLVPEFGRMSLKPALGSRFWSRYKEEMKVRDAVVIKGVERKLPRYYDKLWEREDPVGFAAVKARRDVLRQPGENRPARLAARKAVAEARLLLKKRGKV